MPSIVNISPRVLPRAVAPDSRGVMAAADILLEDRRLKDAQAARAAELQAQRDFEREMLGARTEAESGLIRERAAAGADITIPAETESALAQIRERGSVEAETVIPAQTDARLREISAQGGQARETAQFGYELGSEDRAFERDMATRSADQGDLANTIRLNESIFRMNTLADQARRPSGNAYPLSGLSRDFLERIDDLTPDRAQDLIGVAAGDTSSARRLFAPAGEATGGRMTTPPQEGESGPSPLSIAARTGAGLGAGAAALGPAAFDDFRQRYAQQIQAGTGQPIEGGGIRFETPTGSIDMDAEALRELSGLSLEDHVRALRMLDPETQGEYLSVLPDDVQEALRATLSGGG